MVSSVFFSTGRYTRHVEVIIIRPFKWLILPAVSSAGRHYETCFHRFSLFFFLKGRTVLFLHTKSKWSRMENCWGTVWDHCVCGSVSATRSHTRNQEPPPWNKCFVLTAAHFWAVTIAIIMEIAQMKYLGGSYWQMLSIIFVYLNLFRVFVCLLSLKKICVVWLIALSATSLQDDLSTKQPLFFVVVVENIFQRHSTIWPIKSCVFWTMWHINMGRQI